MQSHDMSPCFVHIKNLFGEKELSRDSVVKESLTTAADGKNYATQYLNPDVVISVGYRLQSNRGPQGLTSENQGTLFLFQRNHSKG